MDSRGQLFDCNFYQKCKLEVQKSRSVQNVVVPMKPVYVAEFQQDEEMTEIDRQSRMGQFGWPTASTDKFYGIPFILRNSIKYFSVDLILKQGKISTYMSFIQPTVYEYYLKVTEYATLAECHLLNEINKIHCDSNLGERVFTTKSLLIKDIDAYAFYDFLDTCFGKLSFASQTMSKIGFLQFNFSNIFTPFVIRNNELYMPLYCFSNTNNMDIEFISGWDLAYLRFCCLYQGIWRGSSDIYAVISLASMRAKLPPNTNFVTCWPPSKHGLLRRALFITTTTNRPVSLYKFQCEIQNCKFIDGKPQYFNRHTKIRSKEKTKWLPLHGKFRRNAAGKEHLHKNL